MSEVLPAAVSTALRATLSSPVARTGRVLAAFPPAVYIALDDPAPGEPAVLALLTSDATRLPNALVVAPAAAHRPFDLIHPGHPVVIGQGTVRVPALAARAARWWDPRPRLRADHSVLRRTVPALADALREQPSAIADRLGPLARALAEVDRAAAEAAEAAAAGLLGLGPGLTPAGDDVLAGTLATLFLLAPLADTPTFARRRAFLTDEPVRIPAVGACAGLDRAVAESAVGQTTALSAALLDCARRGQVATPVADLLRALTGDGDVAAAARSLVRVGHASGRDLAAGVLLAARALVADGDRAPGAVPVAQGTLIAPRTAGRVAQGGVSAAGPSRRGGVGA